MKIYQQAICFVSQNGNHLFCYNVFFSYFSCALCSHFAKIPSFLSLLSIQQPNSPKCIPLALKCILNSFKHICCQRFQSIVHHAPSYTKWIIVLESRWRKFWNNSFSLVPSFCSSVALALTYPYVDYGLLFNWLTNDDNPFPFLFFVIHCTLLSYYFLCLHFQLPVVLFYCWLLKFNHIIHDHGYKLIFYSAFCMLILFVVRRVCVCVCVLMNRQHSS